MEMARERSSARRSEDTLEEPYAAPPTRNPKWGFTIRFEGKYQIVNFHALYAAKKHIEAYINGHKFKWLNQRSIMTDAGLYIQSEQDDGLEQVFEHEYSPLEEAWQVPSPWDQIIARFIQSRSDYVPKEPVPKEYVEAAKAPRENKRTRTPKEPHQAKLPLGDTVTVAEIATALGIDASKARAALRSLKWEKPEGGWQWPKAKETEITKAIKGAL